MKISRTDIAALPLLPISVCYIFGIVLYGCGFGLVTAIILAIAAVACLWLNPHFSVLALCGILGLGQAYIAIPLQPDSNLAGHESVFYAEIKEWKETDSGQSMMVSLDSAGSSTESLKRIGKTFLSVLYPDFTPEFEPGQRLKFRCTPEFIVPQYDLPDEIAPEELNIRNNIYLKAVVTSNDLISVDNASGLSKFFIDCRKKVLGIIYESNLTSESKSLMAAMLTGDRTTISRGERQTFNEAGLSHILAISGLHIGVICFILSIGLWPLLLIGVRKCRLLTVIILLWLFAAVTGMPPSVLRAVIMTTTYMVAKMIQRNSPPLNSLCFAALLILLFDPAALFDVGFQLSFAAVAAILVFANRINPVSPKRRTLYFFTSYISVAVSAMMGTGVISILHYHYFPVYFLIANILIAFILPVFIGGGMVMITGTLIGCSMSWSYVIINRVAGAIMGMSNWVAGLPGSQIDGLYIAPIVVVVYLVLLLSVKMTIDFPSEKKKIIIYGLFLVFVVAINLTSTQKALEPKIYLSRDLQHTELLICNPETGLTLLTNTPEETMNVMDRARFRYDEFMGKRGIDSITIDTSNMHSDRMITIGKTRIALLSGKRKTFPSCKINYVVVSKGFRSNMKDLKGSYDPDTIIISSDIHPKRAKKYAEECTKEAIPFIVARERPWSYSYPSSLRPIVK